MDVLTLTQREREKKREEEKKAQRLLPRLGVYL